MRSTFFIPLLITFNAAAQQNIKLGTGPAIAEIFATGMVSTGLSERDFALSPDGTEIFYTLQSPLGLFQTIVQMKRMPDGKWSKPGVAPFAGRYSDLEPAFSSDGKKMFFSSNRPISGTEIKDFDIWFIEKKNGRWGQPTNIGMPVNTPADEFYPSITKSGNLYFTAAYKNAVGKEDIYLARWENGKYSEPLPLDTAVNSKLYEFNAFVSPNEDCIIFTSYGRKDDKGKGDLYMSIKDEHGKWQPAKNLAMLNSERLDYCPFVSFDKKILFFTSERTGIKRSYASKQAGFEELVQLFTAAQNGGGDIYWVNFEKLMEQFK